MRAAMAVAAVLGGLCWVVALWVGLLSVVGAVLLAVAAVGAGVGLVSRGATWLRLLVGICFLGFVGSVLQVLRQNADDQAVLALAGAAALVAGVVVLVRRPATSRGSHAA
ncbi:MULTISPECIES: hypothetical protein [unclassified Nocardioides]|uniref:hypothetical protein n=1 Tax=unclassified Nocardioides TaxID=2615069 RepID=UPI000AC41DF1|nr:MULTISPECIES: hypothetical protein [unclassified Nocardioides]